MTTIDANAGDAPISLAPIADLQAAIQLRETLCQRLATTGDIRIDASAVSECDLATIQVIEAARLSVQRDGRAIALCAPAPAALMVVLKRAGFDHPSRAHAFKFWTHEEEH